MKKVLSLIAVVLVLATCLPFAVFAADEIAVSSAKSDATPGVAAGRAEAAIPALRNSTDLWYAGSLNDEPKADERYITLGLKESADISSVSIQWYQGGSSATDIKAEKDRVYLFVIQASTDGENFTTIYSDNGDFAKSGTGADPETYNCTFSGANYIRIRSCGCDSTGDGIATYFAIREIRVFGEGKGGAGGNAGSTDTSGSAVQPGESGGSTAPSTGNEFAKIAIFGGVAILAGTAVIVLRKKIRER